MSKNNGYRDNTKMLKRRIRHDYKLPKCDPVIEAMLDETAWAIERGGAELEPIREKYSDLLCPWCGKLHYSEKCEEQCRKFEISREAVAK